MNNIYPELVWEANELHQRLVRSLDESFAALSVEPEFADKWRNRHSVPGTKTMWQQASLLGKGGSDRQSGGLLRFATEYCEEEERHGVESTASAVERCSYDRYQDFAFYSGGDWYAGIKRPLLVAEVESNSAELLGELSGLLSVRCPVKYLFIAEDKNTFDRLTRFCGSPSSAATDWAGTTYFVIEIPGEPHAPSGWTTYRADALLHGEKLCFRRLERS